MKQRETPPADYFSGPIPLRGAIVRAHHEGRRQPTCEKGVAGGVVHAHVELGVPRGPDEGDVISRGRPLFAVTDSVRHWACADMA